MKCPFCGGEMLNGEIVCKPAAGPTFYPRNPQESENEYFWKRFWGSKDAVSTLHLDEAWHCPACEKTIVVWSKKK